MRSPSASGGIITGAIGNVPTVNVPGVFGQGGRGTLAGGGGIRPASHHLNLLPHAQMVYLAERLNEPVCCTRIQHEYPYLRHRWLSPVAAQPVQVASGVRQMAWCQLAWVLASEASQTLWAKALPAGP